MFEKYKEWLTTLIEDINSVEEDSDSLSVPILAEINALVEFVDLVESLPEDKQSSSTVS